MNTHGVPWNEEAVLVDDFVVSGGGALVHDVQRATFDATFTLDGSLFLEGGSR